MSDKDDQEPIREPYMKSGDTPRLAVNPKFIWRLFAAFVAGVVIFYLLFMVPLPYYVYQPGTAERVRPMVSVKQASDEEKGDFLLTTVSVIDANAFSYAMAKLTPNKEIRSKGEIFQKGESEKEYTERQQYIMLTSQSSAIQTAYKKANIPYKIQSDGVVVLRTLPDMPAAKLLQAGDIIMDVDGKKVVRLGDLSEYLQTKKLGDTVKLSYKRGKSSLASELTLSQLADDSTSAKRIGIGIEPGEMLSVKADQPEKQVNVNAGEIGGPSAGLMFSLEIYNQLVPGDITKGYRVAGTGTIDETKGKVGVIGGIQFKIVAADREGADIFFAPKDYVSPDGKQKVPNATDAIEQAKKIHSKMTVVPVDTIDDAIAYLEKLPPKNAANPSTAGK